MRIAICGALFFSMEIAAAAPSAREPLKMQVSPSVSRAPAALTVRVTNRISGRQSLVTDSRRVADLLHEQRDANRWRELRSAESGRIPQSADWFVSSDGNGGWNARTSRDGFPAGESRARRRRALTLSRCPKKWAPPMRRGPSHSTRMRVRSSTGTRTVLDGSCPIRPFVRPCS
jgi:hypothetical protein